MPKPYIPNDKWSRKAAEEGYRARSVYKLQELDERFDLIHPRMKILDVGAAPGSWLQYVSKKVGPEGMVLGIDLKPIVHIAGNVKTAVCDLTDTIAVGSALASVGWDKADLILSDIAPNTSGIKDIDQWKSVELSRLVFELSKKFLRPSGTLVMKVFRGKSFDPFIAEIKAHFPRINVVSVEASRDRSREVYVVCFQGKKPGG